MTAGATTLRVNNVAGTAAQFSSVTDALEAAKKGDVIIIEPSSKEYDSFDVKKKVTIKGPGYFLDVNGISNEGAASSKMDHINIYAEGVVLSGVECKNVTLVKGANNVIIKRNKIESISLGGLYGYDITEEEAITGTIIHQNLLFYVDGPTYGAHPTGVQMTNNIFRADYSSGGVSRIRNSVFRYNTCGLCNKALFSRIENSVFETTWEEIRKIFHLENITHTLTIIPEAMNSFMEDGLSLRRIFRTMCTVK